MNRAPRDFSSQPKGVVYAENVMAAQPNFSDGVDYEDDSVRAVKEREAIAATAAWAGNLCASGELGAYANDMQRGVDALLTGVGVDPRTLEPLTV